MTEASGSGNGPVEMGRDARQICFGRREYAGIDVAAQHRRPRPGPIGSQQPRRQQRIAQMQAAIFVDQQRAHDEAGLIARHRGRP